MPSNNTSIFTRHDTQGDFYHSIGWDSAQALPPATPLQEVGTMPETPERTPEESPSVTKGIVEPTPDNAESVLLSAKLTRNAVGLTLLLRSPILEKFFKVLSNGGTYTAGSTKRWKVTNPQVLNSYDAHGNVRWQYPAGASLQWVVEGGAGSILNLQILTTVGLGSGVNLISDVPMTRDAMKLFLENLKEAAREIYMSFCTPIEGEINLSVTEKTSIGVHEVNDR